MRVLPFVALLVAASGCNCRPPPVQLEDGGSLLAPECAIEADCALGEACVEGKCQRPINTGLDGSTGCTSDAECPTGERCLRSAGVCVPDAADAGNEPVDSGVVGDCLEGETQTCGSSKLGECRLGIQTCLLIDGVPRFGACVGSVDAIDELCNGLDDDCDGMIDDGFAPQSCGVGDCARTVDTCVGGMSITCNQGPSSAEVCDGRDNDCNGMVDDAIPNIPCGVGVCARSVPACVNGMTQACVPAPRGVEVCNGLDDDCDSATDEELGRTSCGVGQCGRTVDACTNGAVNPCVQGASQPESCNMLDDNCDGLIDETCACNPGATQNCYTGTQGTQGVGVCHVGTQTCSSLGAWGGCTGENKGTAESCNGLDDDCNAQVDDGLGSRMCGIGGCQRSVQACVGGMVQACVDGAPTAETCNNVDDDCDTLVDDNLGQLPCGVGACARSVAACVNGAAQTCSAGPESPEVCNLIDDDCDGTIDDNVLLQGTACSTGQLGVCAAGTSQCTAGALRCQQTVMPSATENCTNGLDDNCNGIVDDPASCGGCPPTALDRDFDGSNECYDCNDGDGTIRPGAPETCNGKDDNCNLIRDEGFDVDMDGFTSCGTAPAPLGVDPLRRDCNDNNAFVFPLKATDCGSAGTPATANGVDDNCNGYPDETCGCSAADFDGDGVSPCGGDCDDRNNTVSPNKPEICDGLDNDCNKNTVDNCGVSDSCGAKVMGQWTEWTADRCQPDLVCVGDFSTGALTCGSFCNQTLGGGINDSCKINEGCNSNLLPTTNLHLCAVLPIGAKATGQTCSAESECRSGDCVVDGTAIYCTDKCTHEAGCSANTTCTIRRSVVGSGPTQTTYLWSACRLDSRITATKTLGQSCTGAECRVGPDACFNGKCVEPCCASSDCPGGYACSIAGPKVAARTGQTAVTVVPSCVASTAVRVSGAACTANSECRSGLCEKTSSICIDVCCNDSSCLNGTTCEPVSLKLNTGEMTTMRACVFSPVPTLIEQK